MSQYIAVAYRWGDLNGETIILGASNNLEEILRQANDYGANRGGKYGVAVWKKPYFGEIGEIVSYFPSMNGETSPEESPVINVADRVGHIVLSAAEYGTAWLADPDPNVTTLVLTHVEIPGWLTGEIARIKEQEEFSAAAMLPMIESNITF